MKKHFVILALLLCLVGCKSDAPDYTFQNQGTDFINEGIFFEDEALYPIFRNLVTERIQNAESYDEKMRRSKWGKTRLHHLEYQKKALFEDNRGDFLDSMEQQKANVIDLLERKYLLPF